MSGYRFGISCITSIETSTAHAGAGTGGVGADCRSVARRLDSGRRHSDSQDELESIYQASLKVLSEIGINVVHDGACAIMQQVGVEVTAGQTRGYEPPAMRLLSKSKTHLLTDSNHKGVSKQIFGSRNLPRSITCFPVVRVKPSFIAEFINNGCSDGICSVQSTFHQAGADV